MIKIKGLFNDNESNIDYIGYDKYISVFKYIICNKKKLIEPPIVFGLHGDWGIGKSTFMNLLKNELEKDSEENIITVKINPWEYKNSDDIISLFFIELYKKLKENSLLEKLGGAVDFLFELIRPLTIKFNNGLSSLQYDVSKIKDDEKLNIMENYIDQNHYRKECIDKLFSSICLKKYKIVIFVDDLDRCSVNKVIDTLEAIKLFLNTNKCIFFLGCDVNYLNSAVANYYKEYIKVKNNSVDKNSLKRFTREYLEKIIQVPFHIPNIDRESMEKYVDSIIDDSTYDNDDIDRLLILLKSKAENFNRDIPKVFVKELFSKRRINPRRIKRVLNIIYLNYLFLITKIENITTKEISLLVLLAIINDENHDFYEEKLSSKENCIDTFHKIYLIINKNEDSDDDGTVTEKEDKIESFMNVFFDYFKINSENDIDMHLENIENILTVSNTTHITTELENNWGELGKIQSVSKTKRTFKSFLDNIDDKISIEFLLWFAKEIFMNKYKQGNLQVGIYNNCNAIIFKSSNSIVDNYNSSFVLKFNYNMMSKQLKIMFKTIKYKSIFYNDYINQDELTIKPSEIDTIKVILINMFKGV